MIRMAGARWRAGRRPAALLVAVRVTVLVTVLAALPSSRALAQAAPEVVGTLCQACHGEGGNPPVPNFPQLAGQRAEYLERQLRDFLAGRRANDAMTPVLASIKPAEVPALAAYYAAQKPKAAASGDAKLVAAGKALYDDGNTASGVPACVGCHAEGAVGNERYPRLASQQAVYAVEQMKAFKSGARKNDKGRVMRAVAERLSEQEMLAVAEYLAALP